jgi:hypothetical protein
MLDTRKKSLLTLLAWIAFVAVSVGVGRADVGYAVDNAGPGSTSSDLYFVNFTAGTFSLIGNVALTNDFVEGLALSAGGTLYGMDGSDNLYTINTTTGSPTLVADTNDNVQSIRFVGSTLYGIEFNEQPFLDTINTSTGQLTQVVQATSVLNGAPDSLTFLNSTTAVFVTSNNELYEMNITTGNVTDLGNLGGGLYSGIDYGSGGTLYGADNGGDLATINLATAMAKVYAANADSHNDILDITVEPTASGAPEPATWALMGAGLASVALRYRRRRG